MRFGDEVLSGKKIDFELQKQRGKEDDISGDRRERQRKI